MANFVRSLLSGDSPFHRFINGDRGALSAEPQAGLRWIPIGAAVIIIDDLFEGAHTTIVQVGALRATSRSGGGAGLGVDSFLYSAAFSNLPAPSTYSVNAVTIPVGLDQGNGFSETVYIGGDGVEYNLFLLNPEPSTFALLMVSVVFLGLRLRNSRLAASERPAAALSIRAQN